MAQAQHIKIDKFTSFGEAGLLVFLTGTSPLETALASQQICTILKKRMSFKAIIPGLNSVGVQYDPHDLTIEHIESCLRDIVREINLKPVVNHGEEMVIPICTDDQFAIDIEEVIEHTQLDRDAIIAQLTAAPIHVLNMGFAPGFAYLGPLDDALNVPRRLTPRVRVPLGSIAIAAGYAGLYSLATPGGWHIVGRTPLRLFDAALAMPFRLKPGLSIRFETISRPTFDKLSTAKGGIDG